MPASSGAASRSRAPVRAWNGMSLRTSRPSTVEEPQRSAAPRARAAVSSSAEPRAPKGPRSLKEIMYAPTIATAKQGQ